MKLQTIVYYLLRINTSPSLSQLKYTVSRKRRHFGSPCSFSKYSAENKDSYMEIVSQEDTNFELHRAEVDTAVQVRGRGREGGREERTDGLAEKEGSKECMKT